MRNSLEDRAAEPLSAAQPIDFSRLFMPEELTPLYHTSVYRPLSELQRRRYNQLNALYFNEQIMFFERALARNVLGYFLARPLPPKLQSGLTQFMAEEEQHSAMFRRLNRRCAPALYRNGDFYFIQMPPLARRALNFASRKPQWFPWLLWLMHVQEERALFFGRAFLRCADLLEPHFVAVQRKHVADEIGHVHWDEALLDWVWPKTGLLLRRFNTWIFGRMIAEYFSAPKRSAMRVLAAWVEEFPELKACYSQMRCELEALATDRAYQSSLYNPRNVPDSFKRFDAWPEFQSLGRAMPGYVPGANQ